jgi:hypothetical protein
VDVLSDPIGFLEHRGNRIVTRAKHIARSPSRSFRNFLGHQGSYPRDRRAWGAFIAGLPFLGLAFPFPFAFGLHYVALGLSGYMMARYGALVLDKTLPRRPRMQINDGDTPGKHSVLEPDDVRRRPSQDIITRLPATVRPLYDPSVKRGLSRSQAEKLSLSPTLHPQPFLEDPGPGIPDPPGPPPAAPSSGMRVRQAYTPYHGDTDGLPPHEERPADQLTPDPSVVGTVRREQGLPFPGGSDRISDAVLPGV